MKHKRQQIDAENLQLAALYGPLIQQQAAAASFLRNSGALFPGPGNGLEHHPFMSLPGSPAASLFYNNPGQFGLSPNENHPSVGLPLSTVFANGSPAHVPLPTPVSRNFPGLPGTTPNMTHPLIPNINSIPHEFLKLTSSLVGNNLNFHNQFATKPPHQMPVFSSAAQIMSPIRSCSDSTPILNLPKMEPNFASSDSQKLIVTNATMENQQTVKSHPILTEKLQKLIQCVVHNE